MKRFANILTTILGSRAFLCGVIIFLAIEGLWIALSAQYPMAFDEDFHFGIIQLYAQQWSPILPADAGNSGVFGPVIADPSYLYHYLMSFPYRLVSVFTDSQETIIISLRLINVALFTYGVALFARLLRRVGSSQLLTNTAIALFALIPVVPLLAGHINYDNVLMVIVAWTCLLVVRLWQGFQKQVFDLKTAVLLLAACAFGAAVKYAYIPLALAALAYCLVVGWRSFRTKKKLLPAVRRSYLSLSTAAKVGVLTVFVAGSAFALIRYGSNVISYGTPLPDCAKVLSVKQCLNYGPWARNHNMSLRKGYANPDPIKYTQQWLKGLHKRLFFMINGPHHHYYQNYPPPPLPANTATVIAVVGFGAVLLFARRIFRQNPILIFLVMMSFVYIAALWINNYTQFLQTGGAVAVNGRYLLPVLLPLAAVLGAGFRLAFNRMPLVRPYVATLAILLFLQAGGVFSFIIRSDDTWYWPNQTVIEANHAAKQIFDPVMYQGSDQYKN